MTKEGKNHVLNYSKFRPDLAKLETLFGILLLLLLLAVSSEMGRQIIFLVESILFT